MTHAARDHDGPQGTSLLSHDLSEAEPDAAPVLASADALLTDDLTEDEDDRFASALNA